MSKRSLDPTGLNAVAMLNHDSVLRKLFQSSPILIPIFFSSLMLEASELHQLRSRKARRLIIFHYLTELIIKF